MATNGQEEEFFSPSPSSLGSFCQRSSEFRKKHVQEIQAQVSPGAATRLPERPLRNSEREHEEVVEAVILSCVPGKKFWCSEPTAFKMHVLVLVLPNIRGDSGEAFERLGDEAA
jgi:hypothetical protein